MLIADLKKINKFIVLFIIIFDTLSFPVVFMGDGYRGSGKCPTRPCWTAYCWGGRQVVRANDQQASSRPFPVAATVAATLGATLTTPGD